MGYGSRHQRPCEALRTAMMALVFLACTGCVVFPLPSDRHKHGSRRTISRSEIAALIPGETTLTQVLMRLGEPAYVYSDPMLVGYNWDKITSEVWIFWLIDDGEFDRYTYGRSHNLDLTFDGEGKLLQHRLRQTPFEERSH